MLYCVLQIRIRLDPRNISEEVWVVDQFWSSSRKESCHHRRICSVHEYGSFYTDSSRFRFFIARLLSFDDDPSDPLLLDDVARAARWAASYKA